MASIPNSLLLLYTNPWLYCVIVQLGPPIDVVGFLSLVFSLLTSSTSTTIQSHIAPCTSTSPRKPLLTDVYGE
ncbi:hypothetical protein ACN42_g6405 [Penicillium freii]|uniref:Uncharacterized protein n=1 Tax=Penicillium freii TaxID=48697 RepID=A0A101MHI4_PENFR|nr:hypothetical protein ACN42_g6405 [Penicillium freii]